MSENKTELPPWDFNEYLRIKYFCKDCKMPPSELIEDPKEGTLICGDCGRVLEDRMIDNREEWRSFSGENEGNQPDPSRVGKGFNPFLKGEQLSTKIAVSDGSNKKAVTELARTQQKSTVEAVNTKLGIAFDKIDAYCGNFQIPTMVSNAAKQVVSDAKMAGVGGSMDAAWCLACIYVGSKRTGHQIDKRRITEMGGGIKMKVWTKHVFELNRFGVKESQQKITKLVEEGKTEEHAKAIVGETSISGRITPRSVLPAHCQKVGIPVWTETIAAGICDAIDDILVLGGRGATNIATTAIYIATHVVGNPRMFDEIYPLSGLQKTTMRTALKKVWEARVELMSNRYWPTDERVNKGLMEGIMDRKWFAAIKKAPAPAAQSPIPQPGRLTQAQNTPSVTPLAPVSQAVGSSNGVNVSNGQGTKRKASEVIDLEDVNRPAKVLKEDDKKKPMNGGSDSD